MTFTEKLDSLKREALGAAKAKLNQIGGSLILPTKTTLYVDPANDSGFLYSLQVNKVIVSDNHLMFLAEMSEEEEKEIITSRDPEPDKIFVEGSECIAEYEGLLEVIDQIIDYQKKTYWALFNKNGERLYQYGATEYEDEINRRLAKAREQYPSAGIHAERISEEDL